MSKLDEMAPDSAVLTGHGKPQPKEREKSIHRRDAEYAEFGIFDKDSLLRVLRASAVNILLFAPHSRAVGLTAES
jgi:hypothetical protein